METNKINYIEDNFHNFEIIEKQLWWQKQGLQYTASGYGSKIPTSKMVKIGKKIYRLYCVIYSNIGSCYIIVKKNRYYLRYDNN